MKVPVPDEILPADRLGRVHFVGIGGAGLSGIARIMLARGIAVSGSDGTDSPTLEALRALGARVHLGHDAAQVADVDTLVVSTAVREDNPEYVEAVRRGLRVLPRSAALAAVMAGRRVVAVAGTHGKTTTTSLLTVALQVAGADPTYAIGGDLTATGVNAADGRRRRVRRRGRRERRRVPALRAVRRDRHQRRGRPPRQLGDRGGLRARRSTSSSTPSTPTGSWSAASTTPAPRRWPSGSARPAGGWSTVSAREPGALAGVTLWSPGEHYLADALAALAAGVELGYDADDARARHRVVHRHQAADGAQGRGRRRPGLRQLRPPPDRDRRRPRRPPARSRGRAG